jgi:hypothetical protein
MARNIGTLLQSATAYQERAKTSRLVERWSEESASRYQLATAKVLDQVQALAAKEKASKTNANLSPTGQVDQTTREVRTFVEALRWLRDLKNFLETKVGNLYGELFVLPASKLDQVVQALRDSQIWTAIGALPQPQRDRDYLRFSQSDNIEAMRALSMSPLPLIADEIRLRGDAERAARLQPKQYRQFIETGQLLNEISAILTDCLDLGREFQIDVKETVDELGPKVRVALDFAIEHASEQGKEDGRVAPRPAPQRNREAVGVD